MKKQLIVKIPFIIYILIVILILLLGKNDRFILGNEMGFSLIFLFGIVPILGIIEIVFYTICRNVIRYFLPLILCMAELVLTREIFNNVWWGLVIILFILSIIVLSCTEVIIRVKNKENNVRR